MKSMKGFTLIELMIVIVMILIVGIIVAGAVNGHNAGNDVSFGYNGIVETRCIDGYKVLVSDGGRYGGTRLEQLRDQDGKAIPCQQK